MYLTSDPCTFYACFVELRVWKISWKSYVLKNRYFQYSSTLYTMFGAITSFVRASVLILHQLKLVGKRILKKSTLFSSVFFLAQKYIYISIKYMEFVPIFLCKRGKQPNKHHRVSVPCSLTKILVVCRPRYTLAQKSYVVVHKQRNHCKVVAFCSPLW